MIAVSASFGCTGPQYADKADDVVETPQAFAAPTLGQTKRDGWCTDFGNSELDQLVADALGSNLELRAAWARLEAAEAVSRQADASWFPTVSAQAQVGRSKVAAGPPLGTLETNSYQVSLPVSYELDLFGKLAAQREAAELDVQASRLDAESLAMSMSAQVAEAWLDVVAARQRIALLEAQVDVAQRYLELTRLRLSEGIATALDVNAQLGDIYGLEARLEQAQVAEQVGVFRLEALLGQTPTGNFVVASAELPNMPGFPEVGVPADVLAQRPDVKAAEVRLRAADARTATAARNQLPTIRLTANPFYQATELSSLFDELFWSIAAQITQPIFEGGRRDAAVDQSAALAKAQLYAYGQTVVRAVQEVQAAIVQESRQSKVLEKLEAQQGVAQTALDLARERYRSGTLDYLRVLTSLRTVQNAEQAVLDARRQQLSLRVQTCRALGGPWTQELTPPSEEQP